MSRSLKHHPAGGHTKNGSEKQDKRYANRAFRRLTNQMLSTGQYDKLPIKIAELVDVWSMSKDGKSYWTDAPLSYLRK